MAKTHLETGLFANGIPYIRGGHGPRQAVIFFGGSALFKRLDKSDGHRYARQFSRLLPAGYRFTILGYAAHRGEANTLDTIVGHLAAIVRAETGPATVIGVSFGGFLALRFAAEHPELVEQLVLLVSAHRFSVLGKRMIADQMGYLREGDLYGLVRDNVALFRRPWFNWLARLKLWGERGTLASALNDPTATLGTYERLFSADLERNHEYAERIAAETLVLGGTADQYFDPDAFAETARMIPAGRLHLFRGETHMLPVERGRDVARALAAFLAPPGPAPMARGTVER